MKKQNSLERTYPNQLLHQSGLESVILNSQTSLICEQLTHINMRSEARNRSLRASVIIQKSQDNLNLHDFSNFDGRKHARKSIPENSMKQHSQRLLQTSYQPSFQPGKSLNNFWKNSKERMETVECIYSQKPMNQEQQIKSTASNSNKHKIRVVRDMASCSDNLKRANIGQKRQINDLRTMPLENLIKLNLKELLNQEIKCEIQSIDSSNGNSCNFQSNKVRASHSADDGCGRVEEYAQNTLNIHKESKKEEFGREDNKTNLKAKQQAALYYPPLWKNNTHNKQYPFTFLARFSSNNASNQDILLTRNEQTKTMPTQATEGRHASNYEHHRSLTRMDEIIPQDLKSKQIVVTNQELQEVTSQNNQKILKEGDYSKEILPLNRFAVGHFFSTQRLPSSRNGNNRQSFVSRQQGVTQSNCFFNNSQGLYKSCEIESDKVTLDQKEDKKQDNCQSCQQLQDGNAKQHNVNPKMLLSDSSSAGCKNNSKTEPMERRTQNKQNIYGQGGSLQLNLCQKTTRNQLETASQQKSIQLRLSNCESQNLSSSLKVPLQEHQSFGGPPELKGSADFNILPVSQTQKLGQQNQLFQKKNLKQFAHSMTPRIMSVMNIQTVRTVSSDRNSIHNIKGNEIIQECEQFTEIGQGNQQNENLQDCIETVEVIPLISSDLLFQEIGSEENSSSKDKNILEAEQLKIVKDKEEDTVLIGLPVKIGETIECVMENRPNTSQCKTRRRMEVKQQIIQFNEQQITKSIQDELPKMLQSSSEKFEKDGKTDSDSILKTQRNIKKRFASMDQIQQSIGNNQYLSEHSQQNYDTEQKLAEKNTQKEENRETLTTLKSAQDHDKSKQKQQKNPFLIKIQRALLRTSKTTEDNSSAAQQNLRKPEGSKLHSDFLSLFAQQ